MTYKGQNIIMIFSAGVRLMKRGIEGSTRLAKKHLSKKLGPAKMPTLSFDSYDAYGFDIDHTLAKYNIPHLFTVRIPIYVSILFYVLTNEKS